MSDQDAVAVAHEELQRAGVVPCLAGLDFGRKGVLGHRKECLALQAAFARGLAARKERTGLLRCQWCGTDGIPRTAPESHVCQGTLHHGGPKLEEMEPAVAREGTLSKEDVAAWLKHLLEWHLRAMETVKTRMGLDMAVGAVMATQIAADAARNGAIEAWLASRAKGGGL